MRSCQAETSISDYLENLVHEKAPPEIGLLIGKPCIGTKDLLFSLIKTPSQAGLVPFYYAASFQEKLVVKKGKKVSSQQLSPQDFRLETQLISEHAHQVKRMMVGGLSILGLYVFCPEAVLQMATSQLGEVYQFVWELISNSLKGLGGKNVELLLLHYDSSNRKVTLKSGSPRNSLPVSVADFRPGVLTFASSISSLVCVICRHCVDLSLHTSLGSEQLHTHVASLLASEHTRLQNAHMAIGHEVPLPEQPLIDVLPQQSSDAVASELQVVEASLYLPFSCPSASEVASTSSTNPSTAGLLGSVPPAPRDVSGVGSIQGVVRGMAYVHKRESVGRALAELAQDVSNSLTARYEILLEEALQAREEEQGEDAQTELSQPLLSPATDSCLVGFPRRVLLPFKGSMQMVEYMMEEEDAACVISRAREMVDVPEIDEQQVQMLEEVAKPASFKTEAAETCKLQQGETSPTLVTAEVDARPFSKKETKPLYFYLLPVCAIIMAIIAVMLRFV